MNTTAATTDLLHPLRSANTAAGYLGHPPHRSHRPEPINSSYRQAVSATIEMPYKATSNRAGNMEMSSFLYEEELNADELEFLAMSEEEKVAAIMATQGIWADRTDEELDDLLAWRNNDRLDELYGPDHFNPDLSV